MLFKNILFLGFAVLTAASPQLDARAGTGKSVSSKTGAKGKTSPATCPNTNEISAGVTCPRVKFTAAQIEKAVKQAKAMKVKGKTGKGLHFPSKYKPSKEKKLKGAAGKSGKGSTGKTVKRHVEDEEDLDDEEDLEGKEDLEDEEDEDEDETDLESGVAHVLQARRARGGGSRTRTKPKTTKPKTTKPKTTKPKTTKDECKAGPGKAKVGKGVYMFPILEKGVWKRKSLNMWPISILYRTNSSPSWCLP